ARRASRSSRGRYLVDLRGGQADEVARIELELQAATSSVDEDRLVVERRCVQMGRQAPTLAERARAAAHIARRGLRLAFVRESGALAERLQVELAVDGDARYGEGAVDRDD